MLSEEVRILRQIRGWTQEELAREIDVSLSTIQRWERQGARPTRLARRELRRLLKEAGIENAVDSLQQEDSRLGNRAI